MNANNSSQPPEPTPLLRQKSRRVLMPVALAVILGGVALISITDKGTFVGHPEDFVSLSAESEREKAFAALKPVHFAEVAPAEIPLAIPSMGLNQADQTALLQAATRGMKLISIALYDSNDEDGDAVTITSNGFSRTIVLRKQLTAVVIPEPQSGFFTLTGAIDGGGGGVTVGIVLPSGPFPLPVMSVGQTLTIPVAGQGHP